MRVTNEQSIKYKKSVEGGEYIGRFATIEIITDLLEARELINEMRGRLIECRMQLEEYEQEKTGEGYNSPILNDVIAKSKEFI